MCLNCKKKEDHGKAKDVSEKELGKTGTQTWAEYLQGQGRLSPLDAEKATSQETITGGLRGGRKRDRACNRTWGPGIDKRKGQSCHYDFV